MRILLFLFSSALVLNVSNASSQILNKEKADSLKQLYESEINLPDSTKYRLAKTISEYSTSPSEMLYYAKAAEAIAKKTNNYLNMAAAKLDIGQAYELMGNLTDALRTLFESADLYGKAGDHRGISSTYIAIGNVYQTQGNLKNALDYYNKSIQILSQLADSVRLATALLNTGELYRTNHLLDTALLYFNHSMAIFKEKGYDVGIAYNLGNTGLVYAEEGKTKKAESVLAKAVKMLKKSGDYYPVAAYMLSMAEMSLQKNETEEALKYAKESFEIATKERLKKEARDASLKLSEIYEASGDNSNALLYYKSYVAYRDSINNLKDIRQMADLRTSYEVSKKQNEVDSLSKTKKIQQLVGMGLVSIILFISTITFLIYRNSKRNKKYFRILQKQKLILQKQHNELEKLNHTKDRFFSILSHDLRGPIGAIASVSALLREYIDDKEQLLEIAGFMESSSSKMSTLLDNLLSWAVKQQGKIPYTPENLALNTLIEESVQIYESTARVKHITIKHISTRNIVVIGDKNSLLTVFRNLLNNALKFTHDGGEIIISSSQVESMAEIQVSDNGVGMSEEKLKNLFNPLGKISTSGTSKEKGMGLGLTLVYEFTQMNNGTIDVRSTPGEGTTFILCLPLAAVNGKANLPKINIREPENHAE